MIEYAQTFPAVCGDFSFYQFPTPDYWQRLFDQTPASLQFGLKVPEEITVARWPSHARYGTRAASRNGSFLDPGLFERDFAGRLSRYADRVGSLIFEFGTFSRDDFAGPGEFIARIDAFLGALPGGFRYAVEIRNPDYLTPDYFAMLTARKTAHVFNAWTRMPELERQVEMPGAFTADFAVVRALLRHGRTYEQAVKRFEPYRATQEADLATRTALVQIADRCRRLGKPVFLFVNNRLEGNAPSTIEAVASVLMAGGDSAPRGLPAIQ